MNELGDFSYLGVSIVVQFAAHSSNEKGCPKTSTAMEISGHPEA